VIAVTPRCPWRRELVLRPATSCGGATRIETPLFEAATDPRKYEYPLSREQLDEAADIPERKRIFSKNGSDSANTSKTDISKCAWQIFQLIPSIASSAG
jgi:hypothetical protein